MHLRNYPHYFVKDGERRAVYYTAEVRELLSLGWRREETGAPKPVEAKELKLELPAEPTAERIEVDAIVDEPTAKDEEAKLPTFDFMTKPELLQYALDRGVDLPNNMLKAELVAECKRLANG